MRTSSRFRWCWARNVKDFVIECWDTNALDWVDEWDSTNSLPPMVRVTLALTLGNKNDQNNSAVTDLVITREIAMPSDTLPTVAQTGSPNGGGGGGVGNPGIGGAGGNRNGQGGNGQGGNRSGNGGYNQGGNRPSGFGGQRGGQPQ